MRNSTVCRLFVKNIVTLNDPLEGSTSSLLSYHLLKTQEYPTFKQTCTAKVLVYYPAYITFHIKHAASRLEGDILCKQTTTTFLVTPSLTLNLSYYKFQGI